MICPTLNGEKQLSLGICFFGKNLKHKYMENPPLNGYLMDISISVLLEKISIHLYPFPFSVQLPWKIPQLRNQRFQGYEDLELADPT